MKTRKTLLTASVALPLAVGSMWTGAANADAATAPPVGNHIKQVSDYKSLGTPTGPETQATAKGMYGFYQNFTGGTAYYRAANAHGAVTKNLTGFSLATYGWPSSGTFAQCGGLKVWTENGSYATGNRWCPGMAYAQPVNAISSVYSGTLYANAKDKNVGDGGLKVWFAQAALKKLGYSISPRYGLSTLDSTTSAALKKYQSSHGLTASGNLDLATWNKLVPGKSWNIDTVNTRVVAGQSATKAAHIAAEINFAKGMAAGKKPYIYGAGDAAYGADCSGLVLQALHAAGLDTDGRANILTDIRYPEYLANALWNYQHTASGAPGFMRVTGAGLQGLQAGDLVFFSFPGTNRASHVAMYVGGNTSSSSSFVDTEDVHHAASYRSLSDIKSNTGFVLGYVRPFV